MKLEVGKKYRVKNGNAPWEVLAIDRCQTAWGICRGMVMSEHTAEPIAEWQDKPDPSEGWRLLEPDEDVKKGDEYFSVVAGKWLITNNHRSNEGKQTHGMYYRRRIAPQYIPYTWDDRDELRGKWFRRKMIKDTYQQERIVWRFTLVDGYFYVDSTRSDELLNEWEWLDGTPCGKVVV